MLCMMCFSFTCCSGIQCFNGFFKLNISRLFF